MRVPRSRSVRFAMLVGVWSCLLSWGETVYPLPNLRASDLPRLVQTGRAPSRIVRVVLEFPIRPTVDPLVWEYRPSSFGRVPTSIRFHFRRPPKADVRSVVGRFDRFEFDLRRRINNVPGIVVMVECSAP